jgi:hypothetical protein
MKKQSKKGVWCFRGALGFEWGVRKANIPGKHTSEDCMMAGIEALEASVKKGKPDKSKAKNEEIRPPFEHQDLEFLMYQLVDFRWEEVAEFVRIYGFDRMASLAKEADKKVESKEVSDRRSFILWTLGRNDSKLKTVVSEGVDGLLRTAIINGIEAVLKTGGSINDDQIKLLPKDRQIQLLPKSGEGGAVIYIDPTVIQV